jgi:hypothetical protein
MAMKKLTALVLMLIITLPACFDDDPSKPSKKDDDTDVSPYSGAFIIADTLVANSCAFPAPPQTVTNVAIEDTTILFGTFGGKWDSLALTGSGTSPEVTVPVNPPECYAHYTVTFSITYTDTDHFYGTYSVAYRKDPGCPNPDPCSYSYRIGGTRN